jgi:putative DNA methylase
MSERRLIEEYLPLGVVHEESSRQKGRRRLGHISALHYWWARRPLPAARAAVYAALTPAHEPIEPSRIAESFKALCAWPVSASAVDAARREVASGNGGVPPKVLDMFAGGGAIPLEAARLGCEATALELNPVAHLIELCTLDYPQRFGPSLADDVSRWGTWLIKRAREEIGDLYPGLSDGGPSQTTLEGEASPGLLRVPTAYLWTRTVPCPNPAARPHVAPLVRQTWLVNKKGAYVALRMAPDRATMTIEYEVVEASTLEGLRFDPGALSRRGSTTCPLCGASISVNHVRQSGVAGTLDQEIMAICLLRPGSRGKSYIGSRDARALIPSQARLDELINLARSSGLSTPEEHVNTLDTQSFRTALYGLDRFADLFTRRQLAMLLTLCRLGREAHESMTAEGIESERAKAIATYLGLLIDRCADYSSSLCRWHSKNSKPETTYSRQALPMTWDFAEVNPFGAAAGNLVTSLEEMCLAIEHCAASGESVLVLRGSATDLPLGDGSQDAVITDPPYYDNISYADLSDFFYVWLKRSVGHLHPEHFSSELTPKRSEAIAAAYRHGGSKDLAKSAYEEMMAASFAEARRVLKPDGIMVCVYAHQTTAGWATLIEAVRGAGFVVVEAWPLDTEMTTRGVALGAAALASSIFLVAKTRATRETGDWANQVRPELHSIVSERVGTLASLGITGTDLVIAAIGAGMRAYTRFNRVEKPNGEELAPDEYLQEVQREVVETILESIFGTDREGLGRVDQETQLYVFGRFEFGDAEVPWDELNSLARGTGVELSEHTNGASALVTKTKGNVQLRDFAKRGAAIEFGRSTIDHLHRVLWLADNEPAGVKDYLETTRPDADRLRLVAHALSRPGLDSSGGRGAEAEACERLLGVWKRMVEDNLFTQAGA